MLRLLTGASELLHNYTDKKVKRKHKGKNIMKIAEQTGKLRASILRLNLCINAIEQEAAVNPEVHLVREHMIDGLNKGKEIVEKLSALVEKLGEEKADEVFFRIQQAQDTSVDFEQYHANVVKALDNEINSYDGDSNG